jgi:hypothetical protein
MRTFKPNFPLATLGTLFLAASCTLITDVDRTKIPTDASGGTAGTSGGTGGSSGSGSGGDAGDGSGGMPEGGSGGKGGNGGSSGSTSGSSGSGASGDAGASGAGGAASECIKSSGIITLGPDTFLADGDTFTLGDGVNDPVVFEFELASDNDGVRDGNLQIVFTGTEGEATLAVLIAAAINDVGEELMITASAEGNGNNGGGGEGGEGGGGSGGAGDGGADSGEAGAADSPAGGSGGEPPEPPRSDAMVALENEAYGDLGDVDIRDTVGNPNFTHTGMEGGAAVACGESPTLCDDDADCATTCDTDTSLCEAP